MNASVINQIKPGYSLETLAVMGKLKYFGHIMRTSDSLEKDLMLGLTDGTRRGGIQRTKCMIILVIIGATGIVTKGLKKNLEAIPGKHSIDLP
jgi:hypothetical protein